MLVSCWRRFDYSPKNIDDQFSKEVFKKFLSEEDAEKKIFLKSDIQELSKYQTQLDDEILGKAPVAFVLQLLQSIKKDCRRPRTFPRKFFHNHSILVNRKQLTWIMINWIILPVRQPNGKRSERN